MSDRFGPHVQMGILAERMSAMYQMDANLELAPHLSHYMEEVEVNIAADSFDHIGFMTRIHDRLESTLTGTAQPRRRDFLQAVVTSLQARIEGHKASLVQES